MENMGLSRGVQWGVAFLEEFGTGRRVFSLPNTPSKKTRQEAEHRAEEATADFSYIRWLGNRCEFPSGHIHSKKDRTKDLRWRSEVVDRFLGEGKTVFAYANNHYQNHSPLTVEQFLRIRRSR